MSNSITHRLLSQSTQIQIQNSDNKIQSFASITGKNLGAHSLYGTQVVSQTRAIATAEDTKKKDSDWVASGAFP